MANKFVSAYVISIHNPFNFYIFGPRFASNGESLIEKSGGRAPENLQIEVKPPETLQIEDIDRAFPVFWLCPCLFVRSDEFVSASRIMCYRATRDFTGVSVR